MSNFYRKMLNVLSRNLINMEHFEIHILSLILKVILWKLIDQVNSSFEFFLSISTVSVTMKMSKFNKTQFYCPLKCKNYEISVFMQNEC